MGAARPATAPYVREKGGVHTGDLNVVILDGHGVQDAAYEGGARRAPGVVGEFNSHEQLRCRYRGDRHVVLIGNQAIESPAAPFCIDEDRGVDNQAGH